VEPLFPKVADPRTACDCQQQRVAASGPPLVQSLTVEEYVQRWGALPGGDPLPSQVPALLDSLHLTHTEKRAAYARQCDTVVRVPVGPAGLAAAALILKDRAPVAQGVASDLAGTVRGGGVMVVGMAVLAPVQPSQSLPPPSPRDPRKAWSMGCRAPAHGVRFLHYPQSWLTHILPPSFTRTCHQTTARSGSTWSTVPWTSCWHRSVLEQCCVPSWMSTEGCPRRQQSLCDWGARPLMLGPRVQEGRTPLP
jgi:hypothetical protein